MLLWRTQSCAQSSGCALVTINGESSPQRSNSKQGLLGVGRSRSRKRRRSRKSQRRRKSQRSRQSPHPHQTSLFTLILMFLVWDTAVASSAQLLWLLMHAAPVWTANSLQTTAGLGFWPRQTSRSCISHLKDFMIYMRNLTKHNLNAFYLYFVWFINKNETQSSKLPNHWMCFLQPHFNCDINYLCFKTPTSALLILFLSFCFEQWSLLFNLMLCFNR